jgi:UDP-GlcNAc:undecaprenyl-phosphate GlcNAc-1-phosphate transferase
MLEQGAYLLAVPLADTTFVVARRLAAGTPPWIGGTDHSGHILLRAGAPAGAVPLTSTALSATIPLAVGLGLDA